MKKILGPVAIALMALCVSGCDFFRALAGRPTSAQLPKTDTVASCCAIPDTLALTDTSSCSGCCEAQDSALAAKDSCCCAPADSVAKTDTLCSPVAEPEAAAEPATEPAIELVTEPVTEPAAEPEATPEAQPTPAPAPKPAPAPETVEETIISNLGQRTGFLKVSVSYNDIRLTNTVESGYYILIGTFRQKSNADRLARQAAKAGLEVTRLEYANGRTALAVRRSDNLGDAFVALGEVRKLSFSPKDACILVVE